MGDGRNESEPPLGQIKQRPATEADDSQGKYRGDPGQQQTNTQWRPDPEHAPRPRPGIEHNRERRHLTTSGLFVGPVEDRFEPRFGKQVTDFRKENRLKSVPVQDDSLNDAPVAGPGQSGEHEAFWLAVGPQPKRL